MCTESCCLAQCTIFRWCQRYGAGRVNNKDLQRPGQVRVVISSTTIAAVDEIIQQNRRITTREIAVELSISKGTVHHIIHKKLGYGKVCAQWVPKHLSEKKKTARTGVLPDPAVSTLKPSILFLRAVISVSMSMAIIYSCTVPRELKLEYYY
ncbi:hypothetical protein AVEN_248855-1 [Araneus ventricosus]|uniref:Mos1 transposase HTH domain-containing protein n=1 Tax=Araneus ventricosus TaxID=182803 RepID=A0A4Y2RW97_ARAVE|nr:hypothetical protein AVEN_232871-1 [Araneus ventricosus]GBN80102.1 hypothetical protein AVEN_248855-1 [Araneus ventricosus]